MNLRSPDSGGARCICARDAKLRDGQRRTRRREHLAASLFAFSANGRDLSEGSVDRIGRQGKMS